MREDEIGMILGLRLRVERNPREARHRGVGDDGRAELGMARGEAADVLDAGLGRRVREVGVAIDAQRLGPDDEGVHATMLLVALGATRRLEVVARAAEIGRGLEMVADIAMAREARGIGHARERGAVAGGAILREEAMRVRDVAGVPRKVDVSEQAGARQLLARSDDRAERIERDRQRQPDDREQQEHQPRRAPLAPAGLDEADAALRLEPFERVAQGLLQLDGQRRIEALRRLGDHDLVGADIDLVAWGGRWRSQRSRR